MTKKKNQNQQTEMLYCSKVTTDKKKQQIEFFNVTGSHFGPELLHSVTSHNE